MIIIPKVVLHFYQKMTPILGATSHINRETIFDFSTRIGRGQFLRKILNRINALISLEIKSRIQKRAQNARLFKCILKNSINARIANLEGTGAGVTANAPKRGNIRKAITCNDSATKSMEGTRRGIRPHTNRWRWNESPDSIGDAQLKYAKPRRRNPKGSH